ncbi:MAG: hypothetical protein K8R21_15985 [Leptospira sp.]|nr:hypothetical protein [Leptospira sp.]
MKMNFLLRYLFPILLFALSLNTSIAEEAKNSKFEHIWNEIYANDFHAAKKHVLAEIDKSGENINILSLYEITLNGLDRRKEAAKIRKRIFEIWTEKHKGNFIKENYPLNLSTYPRIVIAKPSSLIIGSEYFLPYPTGKDKSGFFYNKIVVYNVFTKRPSKFFKLEKSKSTDGIYILYEIENDGKSSRVQSYSDKLPNLRDEINDVIRHLKL